MDTKYMITRKSKNWPLYLHAERFYIMLNSIFFVDISWCTTNILGIEFSVTGLSSFLLQFSDHTLWLFIV